MKILKSLWMFAFAVIATNSMGQVGPCGVDGPGSDATPAALGFISNYNSTCGTCPVNWEWQVGNTVITSTTPEGDVIPILNLAGMVIGTYHAGSPAGISIIWTGLPCNPNTPAYHHVEIHPNNCGSLPEDETIIIACIPSGTGGTGGTGTYENATCCGNPNLLTNGNFEAGNTGFTSDYTYHSIIGPNSLLPSRYTVGNSADALAISPNWVVTDPSGCAGFDNEEMLLVNGLTNQTWGTTSIIWSQTVTGLTVGATYKFCGFAKNLPQCTFDVIPRIRILVNGSEINPFTPIITTSSPCDWDLLDQTFIATSTTAIISIEMMEHQLGDGNDLALDNLALEELPPADFDITTQMIGSSNIVTGSIDGPGMLDDALPGSGCEYVWYVAEVITTTPTVGIDLSTLHVGNTTGNMPAGGPIASAPWNLTTTFPGYTFDDNTPYLVGLFVENCDCFTENFVFHLVGSYNKVGELVLSGDAQQQIISLANQLTMTNAGNAILKDNKNNIESNVTIYPNPTSNEIHIQLKDRTFETIQILDMSGSLVETIEVKGSSSEVEFDASQLAPGIYNVMILDETGQQHATKFVKQ